MAIRLIALKQKATVCRTTAIGKQEAFGNFAGTARDRL